MAPDSFLRDFVRKLRAECLEAFCGISRASRKDGKKIKAIQSFRENDGLHDILRYLIRQKHQKCLECRSSNEIIAKICDFDEDFFDVRLRLTLLHVVKPLDL
jgi:hypothetical protein